MIVNKKLGAYNYKQKRNDKINMSIEQLNDHQSATETAFTEAQSLLDRLDSVEHDDLVLLPALYQKLCAEALARQLRSVAYLRKSGGKCLEVIMVETQQPYMYNVGLRLAPEENGADNVLPITPDIVPIPVLPPGGAPVPYD
jgi:hypothetical protein